MTTSKVNPQVAELVTLAADSFSWNRYAGNWEGVAKALLKTFTAIQAAAIITSKWTRWAADATSKSSGCTAADLLRWMKQNVKPGEVEALTLETYGVSK
jgi:hypothetical protein